jgi:glycosyltransferase involved in cell wall biosynthesis
MGGDRLAVVVSGFPRRSETFALNELLALDSAGLLGPVFATKSGDAHDPQPGWEQLRDRVEVLPCLSPADQAEDVAHRLDGRNVAGIHGYFAHAPAEVAMLAAQRLGIAHGFSMHAKDARKVAADELLTRARSAACVIACNPDVAAEVGRLGVATQLIPHGVDLARFRASAMPADRTLRLLAVGRMVEKKGFGMLLSAVAMLEVDFHLRLVGDGPELDHLRTSIAVLGLQHRVTVCGPMNHVQLPSEYAAAHVVVVPSVMDHSGDRDGLPNVVLEAMASARAVVASDIAAISSAVQHGQTGLLIPPGDPRALADGLRILAEQPAFREELGRGGRRDVESKFELGRCAERLVGLLRTAYG